MFDGFITGQKENENMTKQVLFIQGAGEGAYEEDEKLVKSLRDVLGAEYNVRYPKMPEEEDQGYEAWKARISKELAAFDGEIILVGHSVGSSMLLKYLSEETVEKSIAGIFLIAAPYWGAGGWQVDEFTGGEKGSVLSEVRRAGDQFPNEACGYGDCQELPTECHRVDRGPIAGEDCFRDPSRVVG